MNFKISLISIVICCFLKPVSAQSPNNIISRTNLDSRYAPFYHGVASGDPLPTAVIIWTRYTPGANDDPVSINWEMATDTGLTNTAQSGTYTTNVSKDFTVKVDVTGLSPDTWYYYRFEYGGRFSLTGRTRTAPIGDIDSVRFGVVSCSDYVDGYFHAYRKLAERNDIDAIIHLGDYIYENDSEGSIGRPHEPPERITELNDYRQRYSQYRLDPDLLCVHQMYPFINVWDDHELANDAWMGGAEAHEYPDDGLWNDRKRIAARVFDEWLPIRRPIPSDTMLIYRTLKWGELLDLILLDTRIIGRDSQQTGTAIDDPARYMLGPDQLGWVSDEMEASTAQWKIIGQQVMMAPLEIPPIGPFTTDAWDGYRAERNRFYDTVLIKNIENVVVITGDIHTAWANNLEKGSEKVGVEFISPSITTQNFPFPVPQTVIQIANPHIQYANLDDHGYFILDIKKTKTQADFYFVGDITDQANNSETAEAFWFVNDSTRTLQESTSASVVSSRFPVLQPSKEPPNEPTGIDEFELEPSIAVIGVYPNPFWEDCVVKVWCFHNETVTIRVVDRNGIEVVPVATKTLGQGLHYLPLSGKGLPSGLYVIYLHVDDQVFSRKVSRF